MARIKAISISERKGMRKTNVDKIELIAGFGLATDAHGGDWHRQVSLLAQESIDFMRAKGLDVVAGNFAENITTEGIDLTTLPVGQHLRIGQTELVISQLGKICHHRCAIYHQAGDCVMPREGIFAVILQGGVIETGMEIELLPRHSASAAIICPAGTSNETRQQLEEEIRAMWAPSFIRVDPLDLGEKKNLRAVVQDLVAQQRISRIVIYDPNNDADQSLSSLPITPVVDSQPASTSHRVTSPGQLKEIFSEAAG
jgi:MOSC domain-containing protein YiiM